ncbi:MAG TPA: GyrI-like domain-containing protein [bacterium]|nr:GyrI-like domain-containing protein [bacterium]
MRDAIVVVVRAAVPTLEISAQAPLWLMPMVIGKSYRAIIARLNALGEAAAGAPYIRYGGINWQDLERESKLAALLSMVTRRWDMRIGFPVSKPLAGGGPIAAGTIPAGTYVETMHRGPYRQMGATYRTMTAWCRENGIAIAGESYEIYLNDPRATPQTQLETTVLIPVASA